MKRLLTLVFFILIGLNSAWSNVNPTDINISSSSIDENEAVGTVVGSLTTVDTDVADSHTYSLVVGLGDTDNSDFTIVGSTLQSNATFDKEIQANYSIRIQTNDGNGGIYEEVFNIIINNVNENPVVDPAGFLIAENLPNSTIVGTIISSDVDGDDVSYSIVSGNLSSTFFINSTTGVITVSNSAGLDFEVTPAFSLVIRGTDNGIGNLTDDETVLINLSNVNDAPIINFPGAQTVTEDTDLLITTLSVSDQDIGVDTMDMSLSVSNGTFSLSSSTGLNFSIGDGLSDVNMVFRGILSDINTALNGMVYHSIDDFVGGESLVVSISDNGASGPGGVLTDSGILSITVEAIDISFLIMPVSQSICEIAPVEFFVEHNINATNPISYQWQLNGVDIIGEINDSLFIDSVQIANGGNYRCKVTNPGGDFFSSNALLTVKRRPENDFSYTPLCLGTENSFSNLTTISSGSIVSYSWDFGDSMSSVETDPDHTYAISGDFNLRLISTSNLGCSDTLDSIVQVFHLPILDVTISNVCFESYFSPENNTTITGGTLDHSWNFGDGNSSNSMSPNYEYDAVGVYFVSYNVVSNNGCSDSESSVITVHPKPLANFVVNDGCDSTEILISGVSSISTGTINYSWDFGDGESNIGEMSPIHTYIGHDEYTIVLAVESDKNCIDTLAKTVEIFPNPDLDVTVNQPVCFGELGSILVSASGSTDPYFYAIDSSNFSVIDAWSATAGSTYILRTKDFNGCITADTIIMDEPLPIAATLNQVDDPTCFGLNNGSVNFTPEGGAGSYFFTLYRDYIHPINAISSSVYEEFHNISAGEFVIEISDIHGCTGMQLFDMISPEQLLISVNPSHILCTGDNSGVIEIIANGGIPNYEYSLDGGSTFISDEEFTNLYAGFYLATVKDDNNCSVSMGIEIEEPLEEVSLILTDLGHVSCFGDNSGSIHMEGYGGTGYHSYSVDNISFSVEENFENLAPGDYTAYVTDQNECIANMDFTIVEPDFPIAIDSVQVIEPNCFGDENASTTLFASGGTVPYQYSFESGIWIEDSIMFSVQAGWCDYVVKDNNGCLLFDSVFINQPNELELIITSQNNEECELDYSASIEFIGEGGSLPLMYNINGGANSPEGLFTGLTSGEHIIEVSDANNCVTQETITFLPGLHLPNASFEMFEAGGAVSFENTSTDGDNALWTFGDGSSSTEESPFHFYSNYGLYSVILIMENSCGVDSSQQNFAYGVNGIQKEEIEFLFGPNPSTNSLTIQQINDQKYDYYEMFSTTGELIMKGNLNMLDQIDVSVLSSGMYSVKLGNKFTSTSFQFMKVN